MLWILRTPQAEVDLSEIWSYIARDNRTAADRLIRRITDAFDRLASNPQLGFQQDELRPGLRCKPVKRRYLIFYEVVGQNLRILRVMHGSRKYEDQL